VLDVFRRDAGHQIIYRYTLSTSEAQIDLPITLQVEVSLNSQNVGALCAAAQTAAESDPDHAVRLRNLGRTLYQLLFPGHLHEARLLASRLASWQDPLIISTNDAELPWELLHDGDDFLGVRLALGRQVITSRVFQLGRPIDEIRSALIVSDPTGDLDSADEETRKLTAFLTERGIACALLSGAAARWEAVTDQLRDGGHDIFHYSGHVGMDQFGQEGLRLSDRILGSDEIRALLAAHGDATTNAPPVVFVNGCRSADQLSSICGAFLNTGSRIVMGARYRVVDQAAREFAQNWYGNLLAGMTAGAALQAGRASLRQGPDGTWAALVLFGQPATRLWEPPEPRLQPSTSTTTEARASEPLTGTVWAELGRRLDPLATRVVRRVVESAREFGTVTSFHLAAALVAEDTALAAAVEASDVEHATVVDALDILLNSTEPASGDAVAPAPDEVALSTNVSKVFDRVTELAAVSGRDAVSLDDLTAAFMATGGGHAGELLSQLGVEVGLQASLFRRSGALSARSVEAQTQRAILCARFLSATRGEIVGSYSMLLGFALAGSPVLREALLDQGPVGEKTVRKLFPEAVQLSLHDFSPRVYQMMERAFTVVQQAGGSVVTDADLLVEVLDDPNGTARALIRQWGLDPDRLRTSFATVARATRAGPVDGAGPAGGGAGAA
jgi:hypothetical protein